MVPCHLEFGAVLIFIHLCINGNSLETCCIPGVVEIDVKKKGLRLKEFVIVLTLFPLIPPI